MSRKPGSQGAATAENIRREGLRLIYEHGFEAMSLRQLAAEVGLQPSSLYNHFSSKQELLAGLIHDHMQALLAATEAALGAAPPGGEAQLRAFIAHHLAYHMEKRREVFVANFELRALAGRNRRSVVALRREYEARLIGILDRGIAEGAFAPTDTQVAAYAILAMLTGACTWYRPDGRLSVAQVVALHTALVLDGCRGATLAASAAA